MNIQQYYRLAANTALNGSLAALFSFSILILPIFLLWAKRELIFLAIPFLFYSFVSYQIYLFNRESSLKIKQYSITKSDTDGFFERSHYLLTFMPAPSLRMLIFNPNGLLNGEIRDLHFKKYRWFLPYFLDRLIPSAYGLYDASNHVTATFKWKGKGTVDVLDRRGELIFTAVQEKSNRAVWSIPSLSKEIHVRTESFFADIQLLNEKKSMIGRVRKGWMPLEWAKLFRNANTPVLSFGERLSKEERLFVLIVLIHLYRYRQH